MDVRCGRCGTEYEFDDALVSEKGTSVKCTNCGHQFKVHPPKAGLGVPERWIVRTRSGRELVYTSLRDLQKAIAQRQVGPDDLLSRAGRAPRPLQSIAELEPFFRSGSQISTVAPQRTVQGLGVDPTGTPPPRPPVPRSTPDDEDTLERLAAAPTVTATRSKPPPHPNQRRTTKSGPPPPPPKPALGSTLRDEGPPTLQRRTEPAVIEPEPPTLPRTDPPPAVVAAPVPPTPAPIEPPSPAEVVIQDATLTPTPSAVREAYRSYEEIHTDPRFLSGPPPSRRARSRWIVAVVLLGAVGLFGATVGRKYLDRFASPAGSARPPDDDRVAGMVRRGNELLYDGDLDGAKEQFDKATALAERDPKALAGLARLHAARADILWLKLRLLDPKDEELVKMTHRILAVRVEKADEVARKATEVAPDDVVVLRARVDAFRLLGEVAKARELVSKLTDQGSEPETAYVLAALDMAEKAPGWSTVVDRLRTAAAGERDLGRARGALVYALARAGSPGDAQSELAKIEAMARPHPLLSELRDFVRRFEVVADAGADAKVEVAAVDPAALPVLKPTAGDREAFGEEEAAPAGDFRTLLTQAAAAMKGGNPDRAEALYRAVLARQPGNTEAIAGLGDVARARNDPAAAEKQYDKVLEQNPSFLPAILAKADAKWAGGDRKGALALYRRVLEQAGAGSSYGQRAAARLAEGARSGEEAPPIEPIPAKPDPPAPAAPDQPHIDTTDLPGHGQ